MIHSVVKHHVEYFCQRLTLLVALAGNRCCRSDAAQIHVSCWTTETVSLLHTPLNGADVAQHVGLRQTIIICASTIWHDRQSA